MCCDVRKSLKPTLSFSLDVGTGVPDCPMTVQDIGTVEDACPYINKKTQ